MSVEDNAVKFRRLIEVGFGAGDEGVVDEIVSPACVEHQRGLHPGSEGAKEVVRTLHTWFSEFELKVVDLVADGDKVWTLNRARGINTGSVMGRPPTGRPVEIDVIDIGRFAGGRLVEHWGVPDQLGMMLQLGLMPRPEGAASPVR
jgi:predicted ester cyclase